MKEAIHAYIEAYNAKDVEAMLALLDDHVVFENVSNSSAGIQSNSKPEFEEIARESLDYFLERKQLIRFLVLHSEAAAVEIDYLATVAQDLPNGMKKGE